MTEQVYVGSKPIMNYVTAIITAFVNSDTVEVMARGRAISSAVDAVEVSRNKFIKNIEIKEISIATEILEGDRGPRNVSSIKIVLIKP